MGMRIRAWSFRCDLSLSQMRTRLNAVWEEPWVEGDSAYYDYLGGRLTPHAVARIYPNRDHNVVNLRCYTRGPWPPGALRRAQARLLTQVLPVLGACEVAPTEVFE